MVELVAPHLPARRWRRASAPSGSSPSTANAVERLPQLRQRHAGALEQLPESLRAACSALAGDRIPDLAKRGVSMPPRDRRRLLPPVLSRAAFLALERPLRGCRQLLGSIEIPSLESQVGLPHEGLVALLASLFPTVLSAPLPHEATIDRVGLERNAQAPRLGGLARPSVCVSERPTTPTS